MKDRYRGFATSSMGRRVVRRLGLPAPVQLRRRRPGDPDVAGPVLFGEAYRAERGRGGVADGGRLAEAVETLLTNLGADTRRAGDAEPDGGYAALVFDATGVDGPDALRQLHAFFHPTLRSLRPCGRVLVLGAAESACESESAAAAQAALEGFTRSLAKELRRGATAQLLRVAPEAENTMESSLRFFLSPRSAFVSGQVVELACAQPPHTPDASRPLAGKTALVTGAARGIGAKTVEVLAEHGAHVVCLDVPAAGESLAHVANDAKGSAVQIDLTAHDAPGALAEHLSARHGGVDVVVHNAGITRDKTLARMSEAYWDAVCAVNLAAPLRVTRRLLDDGLLRDDSRTVVLSSVGGIAGNYGQTNYAASKAGLIGMTRALAPLLRPSRGTINAVAPGFIETRMTARMPLATREIGRRLSSLAQGGLPVDVAETVAWLAAPGSAGVNGQVVRVCGQNLLGA
ncbi:MAG: 3-oxoacyl-ACP reductase [Stackebrandtia sp.]